MAMLNLRRIDLADGKAAEQIAALQKQLSPRGDMTTPRNTALTEAVFGKPLTPTQVVERICGDVQSRGLEAVLDYTEKLDGVRLKPGEVRVSEKDLERARAAADPAFLETVRRVRQNIMSFQCGLIHRDAVLSVSGSHELRQRYRPLRRVGICVPGGAAAYPSTLLMTACPAQAAGVREIAVVVPPTPFGGYNQDLLATCRELKINEVYRIGGAQAVAALAYGVSGIPRVDMIVGPGNQFVTLAKRHVFGQVGIDMLAGPTEVVILADDSAPPSFVAADLISQAEHSPGASILITWHRPLLDEVAVVLDRQLQDLSRGNLARESLEGFGAMILANDAKEAVATANQIAPEHLQIMTRNPESLVELVENAGTVFLGPHTPVSLGDYVAGPSHVLPTGGTARFASGLSANDFQRRSSVISFSRAGLEKMAPHVRCLAEKEGLSAHAASVDVRVCQRDDRPLVGAGKPGRSL
jgi:histidinol dehydrogenase